MKQYNRILFVAENGTCRAPMAAGILIPYIATLAGWPMPQDRPIR